MPEGMAQTVKMVMALMAPAASADGGDTLTLPLTLKNSTISVGKIPLAQLRPIAGAGFSEFRQVKSWVDRPVPPDPPSIWGLVLNH